MTHPAKLAYNRKRRQRLVAKGICCSCLSKPARNGLKMCATCSLSQSRWRKKFKKAHPNLCNSCLRRKTITGKTLCLFCRDLFNSKKYKSRRCKRANIRYRLLRARGRCVVCAAKAVRDKCMCRNHLVEKAAYSRARYLASRK